MKYFYLILNGSVAMTLLVLGIVTIINDKKSLLNKLFLAFTACVGVWIAAAYISNDTSNAADVSLYGNYVVFAFSYFSSFFFLWLTVYIAQSKRAARLLRQFSIPIILVGLVSASPLVVAGVEVQDDVYAVYFGPLILMYAVLLLAQLSASLMVLWSGIKHTTGEQQNRLKVIFRSMAVALPILVITQFIAPAVTGSFAITEIGILAMILPVAGLYYSVIKHGLFDIRLAAVRSAAYAGVLLTLSAIYYLLAYLLSFIIIDNSASAGITHVNPMNVGIALVLAFLFQPIKHFFDKLTNGIFYRDNYNTDDFFARINKELNTTTDLRSLLQRAATEIGATVKAEQSFFFVRYGDDRFMMAGAKHHKRLPLGEIAHLDSYIAEQSHQVIVADMLEEADPLARLMIHHKLGIILPLKMSNMSIGYLFLGTPRSRNYTRRDIRLLETISDELVIAIQNALSIQDVEEINQTLQQRIEDATKELRRTNAQLQRLDATKDEFISMASHQLRTPLTSVKGYISMVLEGDAGKITDMQHKLLTEAFVSSERMVHLISDFLNVSRLQTGKFMLEQHAVDLVKVVDEEVDSLQTIAKSHDLKLKFKASARTPILYIDEGKIRQVIMNFIDNAIYYSREFSTITISVGVDAGDVILQVQDTGIGVPESEQLHLFTKFFRATNAQKQRPDGTGVGLFLAKKVIAAHGGSIVFHSVEGEGSTFGFRLPIKKLQSAPAHQTNDL